MTPLARPLRVSVQILLLILFTTFSLGAPLAHAQEGGIHVVVPGDTLSEIAAAYGTDVATLRALNSIEGNVIRIGQRLNVGAGGSAAVPSSAAAGSGAAAASRSGPTYIVQRGDNLSSIAQRYGVSMAAILEANGIQNPRLIVVGQALVIPGGVGADAASTATSAKASSASGMSYTVKAGDNLSSIAQRFGSSVDAILEANGIANARVIRIGQTLLIPGGVEDYATAADPVAAGELPPGVRADEKWIDVDLSEQRVVAYEGTRPVARFRVSTGLPGTPTVTGNFRIRLKIPMQDMSGGNRAAGDFYDLKDVQWVQYFFEDYAFHGTYWHTNFGYPASRGCINMTNADAAWLYAWTEPGATSDPERWQGSTESRPGTVVIVHN